MARFSLYICLRGYRPAGRRAIDFWLYYLDNKLEVDPFNGDLIMPRACHAIRWPAVVLLASGILLTAGSLRGYSQTYTNFWVSSSAGSSPNRA
jgi:hypothetical protein